MQNLTSLHIKNFRNYSSFKLDDLQKFNIFVGSNAVGKTNLIEAIDLVTELSSFRHPRLHEMLPFTDDDKTQKEMLHDEAQNAGQNNAEKSSRPKNEVAFVSAAFDDGYQLQCTITPEKKSYKFNGKSKNLGELKGRYPAVVFTPDDLMLVKGGNAQRLGALDSIGSQVSKNYYTVRKDYSRILRQKRQLLRDGADAETLRAINSVMALPAAQLTCYRVVLCEKFLPLLVDAYKNATGSEDNLDLNLRSEYLQVKSCETTSLQDGTILHNHSSARTVQGIGRAEKILDGKKQHRQCHQSHTTEINRNKVQGKILAKLENKVEQEIAAQRPLVGPHLDKVDFSLAAHPAQDFASQGQQRSIVLAWKLAEVALIRMQLGSNPILLLDDVMSELDATRRHALTQTIADTTQVFITTTNLDYFEKDFLQAANIVNL